MVYTGTQTLSALAAGTCDQLLLRCLESLDVKPVQLLGLHILPHGWVKHLRMPAL